VIADPTGFSLTLGLPDGAVAVPSVDLPAPDVSRIPGARLLSVHGWDAPAATVRAGCVSGPSGRYAPGIEEVLFEKATWMTLTRAGIQPSGLGVIGSADTDRTFARTLEGRDGTATVRIEHVMAFAGDDRDVIFCSALCRGDAAGCAGVTFAIEGTSAPPPRPSLVVRGALLAAEVPMVFFGVLVAVMAATVAAILWRRPYPRP
jgi:hypothetical protein